jgi:hypothetical protein
VKRTLLAAIIIAATVLSAGPVDASQAKIEGDWTFTVEHLSLKLVLVQKDKSVTGSLDWPHGDPIKLTGTIDGETLRFSGDSGGENFTVHIDATGSLQVDDTLTGTLKAHFTDFNDEHQVVRTRNQEIPWTAVRGLHGIVHFPR